VQKHYRLFILTPAPELEVTIRTEYHLLVGVERSVSLVFGGVEGEPAPRQVAGIAGDNIFNEDGTLCFVVDEIIEAAPPFLMGQSTCFVYDPEADTMAPVRDPDNFIMEDCGEDHTARREQPKPRAAT
jgi:hypothetical protein